MNTESLQLFNIAQCRIRSNTILNDCTLWYSWFISIFLDESSLLPEYKIAELRFYKPLYLLMAIWFMPVDPEFNVSVC